MKNLVPENISEYGVGAGFSYGRGSSIFPVNRGGMMNRSGFGGAYNLGGPNMMYTYEIKPLNRLLQPKANTRNDEEQIHIGDEVVGREVNNRGKNKIKGTLLKIVRAENGAIKHYVILDSASSMTKKLDPTATELISRLEKNVALGSQFKFNRMKNESKKELVPESLELYEASEDS